MDFPRVGLLSKRPPLSDSFTSRLDSVFFSKTAAVPFTEECFQLTIVSDSEDESEQVQSGVDLLAALWQKRLFAVWIQLKRATPPKVPKKPQRVRSPQSFYRTVVLYPRLENKAVETAVKKLSRMAQPRLAWAWTSLCQNQPLCKTVKPLHWTLDANCAARVYSRLDKLYYRRIVRGFYAVLRLLYHQ